MADPFEYLGAGIVVPFRRDLAQDVANSSGVDMVESSLAIIMGTLCAGPTNVGEVPFNQSLGTLVKLLRHSNINDEKTKELATYYTTLGIRNNDRRIKVKGIAYKPIPNENKMRIRFRFDVISQTESGTSVVKKDVEKELII
jgi:hypothetical protein